MRRDNGLCQACLECGVLRAATQVDHTVPLFKGGPDTDGNKRALCDECHELKTREDKGHKPSAACDVSGLPADPRHHWNQR